MSSKLGRIAFILTAPMIAVLGCTASSEETGSGAGAASEGTSSSSSTGGTASPGTPPSTSAPKAPQGTTCTDEEETIFRCTATHQSNPFSMTKPESEGKTLVVCASKALSASTGYVQYRYGTEREIELRVPSDAARLDFRATSDIVELPNPATFLRFRDGKRSYLIGEEKDGSTVGAVIIDDDQLDEIITCASAHVSKLDGTFFDKAGLRPATDPPDINQMLP